MPLIQRTTDGMLLTDTRRKAPSLADRIQATIGDSEPFPQGQGLAAPAQAMLDSLSAKGKQFLPRTRWAAASHLAISSAKRC